MSFVEFEKYERKKEFVSRVKATLSGEVDTYERHKSKAFENFAAGFSRDYSDIVVTSFLSMDFGFYDYVREVFGEDVANYYSLMISKNQYLDLLDEELIEQMPPTEAMAAKTLEFVSAVASVKAVTDEEKKLRDELIAQSIEDAYAPTFNRWYYGFRTQIVDGILHFDKSYAYHLLPHEAGDNWEPWMRKVSSSYRAMNIEMCCRMIIEDIDSGAFDRLLKDIETGTIDMSDFIPFVTLYELTKMEMRQSDQKLILAGEASRFNLPLYGC